MRDEGTIEGFRLGRENVLRCRTRRTGHGGEGDGTDATAKHSNKDTDRSPEPVSWFERSIAVLIRLNRR